MPPDAPRIYGPDGRPVSVPKQDLVRRQAAPVRTGFRRAQQWQSVVATLTPERLRAIYWALANGNWCPDYFELAEEIEERDLHYRGVLQQRRLRGAGAPIDVVPASAAAADRRLADEVRERVMQGPGWHGMLLDLLDALGKGVSCLEIAQELVGPLREALADADTVEGFAAAAAQIGAPEGLAEDLARRAFPARVDGEVS